MYFSALIITSYSNVNMSHASAKSHALFFAGTIQDAHKLCYVSHTLAIFPIITELRPQAKGRDKGKPIDLR